MIHCVLECCSFGTPGFRSSLILRKINHPVLVIDCSLGSPLVAARSFFTVMDAIAARCERWLLFVLGGVRALLGAGEQRRDCG